MIESLVCNRVKVGVFTPEVAEVNVGGERVGVFDT